MCFIEFRNAVKKDRLPSCAEELRWYRNLHHLSSCFLHGRGGEADMRRRAWQGARTERARSFGANEVGVMSDEQEDFDEQGEGDPDDLLDEDDIPLDEYDEDLEEDDDDMDGFHEVDEDDSLDVEEAGF